MTTDDIVTRLRQNLFYIQEGCGEFACEYLDTNLTDKDLLDAADEIERLRKLTGSLATLMMPFALLMTKEEQETVMKAVRGEW